MSITMPLVALLCKTNFNIPTQTVWSILGTSPFSAQKKHLSSKTSIDPSGQLHNVGSAGDDTLSPGQTPEISIDL